MKRQDVIDFLSKDNTQWDFYTTLNTGSMDEVENQTLSKHYIKIVQRKLYGKRYYKKKTGFECRGVFEVGEDKTPHLHLFLTCEKDKRKDFLTVSEFAWKKLKNNRGSKTKVITKSEKDYTKLMTYNSKQWYRNSFFLIDGEWL